VRQALEPKAHLDDLAIHIDAMQPLLARTGTVDDWREKTLILNFWGTWCPPCVAEMPLLDRFNREFGEDQFQVVGIAIDQRDSAEHFLNAHQIGFLSFVANAGEADNLMELLGNDAMVLPFSAIFSPDGSLDHVKVGEFEESELATIVPR